ncbi:MAG: PRC-barrel domain-containing protein [Alphaproteobacteria bacterium]|nr:PRC-barrel domain-containing protein [Alphaproteobacteria bacterium]
MASINDPTNPSGNLIAGDQVAGTAVYDTKGERLGSVDDVMIDKVSGRIAYAILSFGGFLGIGDKHHPLPWSTLRYDTGLGGYVVDLDRAMLEGSPAYADDEAVAWEDPAWGRRVHDYYRAEPYWNAVP